MDKENKITKEYEVIYNPDAWIWPFEVWYKAKGETLSSYGVPYKYDVVYPLKRFRTEKQALAKVRYCEELAKFKGDTEMLGNIKIRIKNPEHSACVQKKLFEMGAMWSDGVKDGQCLHKPHLYVDNTLLSYGSDEEFFRQYVNKEVFLVNGEFSEFPECCYDLPHHQGEVIIKNPTKLPELTPSIPEWKPFVPRSRKDAASDRMRELTSAIQSYLERNEYGVPPEWLEEMCELNGRLL